MSAKVKQLVPFFRVTDMAASLAFYVDGLGFRIEQKWIPEGNAHYPSDGNIRWCRLELDDVALMLQAFPPDDQPTTPLGTGVTICLGCDDAIAIYREFASRGVQASRRPFVGNGLWVVPIIDPDGYRLEFSSPANAPEESELDDSI